MSVKVLVQGYVKEKDGQEYASCTVTLIKENDFNIIVDPGMDRELLLNALEKENLDLASINFVVLTHYHLDHALLAGIFPSAQVVDFSSVYSFDGRIVNHDGKVPGTNIEIIKTPGHDPFHCALLVETEEYGKVIVAGDILWWADNQEQKTDEASLLKHQDPYVKDEVALLASRKEILNKADYIIPGHGKMFAVEDK